MPDLATREHCKSREGQLQQNSWDLNVLLFHNAVEMMTMFIDVSTRQIINYLGFFPEKWKGHLNYKKLWKILWYCRLQNIKMQVVIEIFRAHIFTLLVLSGLKCLNFYITEWCVLRKISLHKLYLENTMGEVFSIVTARKMRNGEKKVLERLYSIFFQCQKWIQT